MISAKRTHKSVIRKQRREQRNPEKPVRVEVEATSNRKEVKDECDEYKAQPLVLLETCLNNQHEKLR